ncbi:hypothetical protein ON010_g3551 [Phytophthora cinnamomi]|nr:hypothetical protein ON010_g3551 [Phytophthora cinnamomi]
MAVATLLVSCDGKLSTTAADAVRLTDVVGANARLLRSTKTAYESGEEKFSLTKVQNLLKDRSARLAKFEKWDQRGVTFHSLKDKLDLSEPDMVKLWNLYHAYLGL